jgi:outer membrane protein OmpA-like peptidoglycan-associated protein
MLNRKSLPLLIPVLFLLLSGCAKKTTVVLLPDPDGKIGHITVANKHGEVDLTRSGEATVVSGRESEPSPPYKLSEDSIHAQFSQVLSILPDKPTHFVLYFKNESTELLPASATELPIIYKTILDRNSQYISVIGHSDTAGDYQYNLQLSQKRARNVKNLLITKGVDPALIKSESHGEKNQLVKTADNVHEPKNRRVEVVVR